MRAVHVTRLDGPAAVEIVDLPAPDPGPRRVLVDVHAAGMAFPDTLLKLFSGANFGKLVLQVAD